MVAASLNLWCHSTGAVLALRGNQEPIQQVVWIARHWVCRSSTLPSNDLSDNHNFQGLAHLPGVQIVSQGGNQNGLRRMYMDVSLRFMDLHKTWGKMLKLANILRIPPKKNGQSILALHMGNHHPRPTFTESSAKKKSLMRIRSIVTFLTPCPSLSLIVVRQR